MQLRRADRGRRNVIASAAAKPTKYEQYSDVLLIYFRYRLLPHQPAEILRAIDILLETTIRSHHLITTKPPRSERPHLPP